MTAPNSPVVDRAQLLQQVACLFEADDLIEIRGFGKNGVPVQHFLKAGEHDAIVAVTDRLVAAGMHACVGVAPRANRGGKAKDVAGFRVVYADIDDCTVPEAMARLLKTTLPPPTLIVSSGHGVHIFWRLAELIAVERATEVRRLIGGIARLLSADAKVKDAARVMRLAGTTNVKDPANPVPCAIVECNPDQRCALQEFNEAIGSIEKSKTKRASSKSIKAASPETLEFIANGAAEGERNDRLFRAACDLRANGWSRDESLTVLQPPSIRSGLSDEETVATVDSAFNSERASEATSKDRRSNVPVIVVNNRQVIALIRDGRRVLRRLNKRKAVIFNRHGVLVRLVTTQVGVSVVVIDQVACYGFLVRAADWVAQGPNGVVASRPPKSVAADLVTFVDPKIQRLDRIVYSPAFTRDGTLIDEPGYHPTAATYYREMYGLKVGAVPDRPTAEDVAAAKELIVGELLRDFPFGNQASIAHAVAAMILPFVRAMIIGPTPIHVLAAPSPGSGKGLLSECISIIFMGRSVDVQPLPHGEDEMRKLITALLLDGPPIILLDNLPTGRTFNSAPLAAAITSVSWNDRILGISKVVRLPNETMWLLTANSPQLTTELARRSVRILLTPKTDKPWERTGFLHDPLARWVTENRGRIVAALLTLVQAWIAAGKPAGLQRLGSFECWASTMGGILDVVGIKGFLTDRAEMHAGLDTEANEWREFIEVWYSQHGENAVSVATLRQLADAFDLLSNVIRGEKEKARDTSLGKHLAKRVDIVVNGLKIEQTTGKGKHGKHYRLTRGTSAGDRGTSENGCSPDTSDDSPGCSDTEGNVGNIPPTESCKPNHEPTHADGGSPKKVAEPFASTGRTDVPDVPHGSVSSKWSTAYDGGTSETGCSPPADGCSPSAEIVEGDA